jgi:hypothetical protein
MAELEDSPKRPQALAQLEHVCRIHRSVTGQLRHRPDERRVLEYLDAASQPQRIMLDAAFAAGVLKIRRTLIIECHDYGFLSEVTRIVKQNR